QPWRPAAGSGCPTHGRDREVGETGHLSDSRSPLAEIDRLAGDAGLFGLKCCRPAKEDVPAIIPTRCRFRDCRTRRFRWSTMGALTHPHPEERFMPAITQFVDLDRRGRVAVLTVNNPPVNALSHDVRQ